MRQPVSLVVLGRGATPGSPLVEKLERAGEVMVVGRASDAQTAVRMCRDRKPSCALLFAESAAQVELLATLLEAIALPVVVLARTSTLGVEAVGAGAAEALPLESAAPEVATALRLMAELQMVGVRAPGRTRSGGGFPAAQPGGATPTSKPGLDARPLALVGTSTGGPPALVQLLGAVGRGYAAPIVVVQHMPDDYGPTFVEWLGAQSPLPVHLAQAGTSPEPGRVYVAPSGTHTVLGHGGFFLNRPRSSPRGPCPSVDLLFESAAQLQGFDLCGVLMTGMGSDGARGLLAIRQAGGYTLVQDRASCAVHGMPAEALRLGAAEFALSPPSLGEQLRLWLKTHHDARRARAR